MGSLQDYAGATDPAGGRWFIADGRAISRTTYAVLFAVSGIVYGAGDGSTTFNIPDARGRAAIGAGQGTGLINRALGLKTGEEAHQLTTNEMPAHTHPPGGGPYFGDSDSAAHTAAGSSYGAPTSFPTATGSTGGGVVHNNMQPSIALNKIIRLL